MYYSFVVLFITPPKKRQQTKYICNKDFRQSMQRHIRMLPGYSVNELSSMIIYLFS